MDKKRLSLIQGITLLIVGLTAILLRYELSDLLNIDSIAATFFSAGLSLVGIILIIFRYLQGDFSRLDNSPNDNESKVYLNRRLEKMSAEFRLEIEKAKGLNLDEAKVRGVVEEKVDGITNEALFAQIRDKYENKLIEDIRVKALEEELLSVKSRIEKETARISRNGNINLLIGLATTFIAIAILLVSLLGNHADPEIYNNFIYYFIPRLSLSVFIELFSFFFLRIYKKNLEDIKYFNNERTNIDLKLVALKTALLYDDKVSLKEVILELAKTERNFILKKGDSTVEIEKNKLDVEAENSWKELIKDVVKMGK
jgi:hypothetical protein